MIESWLLVVWRILQVALGIGFVIFVHELGHFLVAKWVGIRVEVFSLGFGPRLLGFRPKNSPTDYRISAVPLGGYVKMAGENPDEPASGAADEFASKPVGARAAVIVAGVCMNAVFAVIGFLLAFKIGVRMDEPGVGRIQPGSAAEQAGLHYGDRIVEIGGAPPLEFMDIGLAAAYASGPLELKIERRGAPHTFTIRPRRSVGSPVQQLGFERMEEVHEVEAGSAAEAAGFHKGDWILGVGGKPLKDFDEFLRAVRESPGQELNVDVRRDDRYQTLGLTPKSRPARTYGIVLAPFPVIGKVVAGTPAAEAGIEVGDVILEAGGAPGDVHTLREAITAVPAGAPLKLVIERAGARREVALTPRREGTDGSGRPVIGIVFGSAVVAEVRPDTPAAAAGLKPGDRLAMFEGKPAVFGDLDALDRFASSGPGEETPLSLQVAPKGGGQLKPVTLPSAVVPGKFVGEAGLAAASATFIKRSPGILEPIHLGFNRTYMFTEQVFLTFQGMFAKRIDPSTLGGPIGIAETAYRVSEYGLGKLLYFLAIISVNLAVLNIFPIPILDGGHLVFLAIEKVKGSPVAPSVQAAAQWAGLAVLLGLMIFVTKNDIVRTFFGG